MTKSNLPKSVRKYLRRRKREIRREFGRGEEARKRIQEERERILARYSKEKPEAVI